MSILTSVQAPFRSLYTFALRPLPTALSRGRRLRLLAAGATVYVLYQNLVNPAVAAFREQAVMRAVEALPGLLGMSFEGAWWLCWGIYVAANFVVVGGTAGLWVSLLARLPPPGLFLTGISFPTLVGKTLESGLGGG